MRDAGVKANRLDNRDQVYCYCCHHISSIAYSLPLPVCVTQPANDVIVDSGYEGALGCRLCVTSGTCCT